MKKKLLLITLLVFTLVITGCIDRNEIPPTPYQEINVSELNISQVEEDPLSLHLDQTTPQSVFGGIPTFNEGINLNNSIINNTNYIDFNTDYADSVKEGRLRWDADDGTLQVGMPGGSVNLQIGQEILIRARNLEDIDLNDGDVVYISGSTGDRPQIKLADCRYYNRTNVIGVVTETISPNNFGYVATEGLVRDLDTSGMIEGEKIWLNNNGEMSPTKPDAPCISVFIGYVIRVHATQGIIIVDPVFIPRLYDLSDTYGQPNETGNFYTWNTTNTRFELDNINKYDEPDITAWKSHRINSSILIADTWTDITWEEYVPEESFEGINYLNNGTIDENKSILVIEGFDDIFSVQGCIHTLWNGAPGTSVGVATRILSSIDNGTTWEESRCLQYYEYNDKGTGAEGTHPYSGTLNVNQTTWIKLQVQSSDSDIVLQGHPIFDKPVSATIYLSNIGIKR